MKVKPAVESSIAGFFRTKRIVTIHSPITQSAFPPFGFYRHYVAERVLGIM